MFNNLRMLVSSLSLFALLAGGCIHATDTPPRDLCYFLRQMRTVEHLPALENSKTRLSSTWHRSGDIGDAHDFKRIEGDRNILLDVDGPGCIHRIFTGVVDEIALAGTRFQIFLDGSEEPIFDLPVYEFFDDKNGPLPYPMVFHKTYPGTLFPIPFKKHCLVQLISERARKNWGNYWQISYTIYPPQTQVRSLHWPLNDADKRQVHKTCNAWLKAESSLPPSKDQSTRYALHVAPAASNSLTIQDYAILRELRIALDPPRPAILRNCRLKIYWDEMAAPSVDVPVGYFFGHADYGHAQEGQFSSLLLAVDEHEAICRFPMPFRKSARIELDNGTDLPNDCVLKVTLQHEKIIPDHYGYFHATWTERRAADDSAPRFGTLCLPGHVALESNGRGKYVGLLMHISWPHRPWWGEGDWLIWTDEQGWPPSYHGTGTEEYFNSGWGRFDRKAVSGYVHTRPGEVGLYSFHINDGFQFQRNIRVAVETVGYEEAMNIYETEHPILGTTAFWYALPAQEAGSRSDLIPRSQ